jgi:hypothetical protein
MRDNHGTKEPGMARRLVADGDRNLLRLIALCVRRPAALGEIAIGGITDRRVLTQLAAAFVASAFVSSFARAIHDDGLSLASLGMGLAGVLAGIGSLLTLAFGLYFLAQLTGCAVRYRDLLSGAALLNIIGWVGNLGLLAVSGLVAVVLPGPLAVAAGAVCGLVYILLILIFMVHFLMGVFDMGCVGSLLLGFLASLISIGIDVCLIVLIAKLVHSWF